MPSKQNGKTTQRKTRSRRLSAREKTRPRLRITSRQLSDVSKSSSPSTDDLSSAATATEKARPPQEAKVGNGQEPQANPQAVLATRDQALERADQFKRALGRGASVRALARQQGCSAALVHNLVSLASLPEELKRSYREGKLGRKKALQMAKEVKPVGANSHPPIPSPTVTPRALDKYAQLIAEFVKSSQLLPFDWEAIFRQIDHLLYGLLRWEFLREAPRHGRFTPVKDPWALIKRCEPERKNLNTVPDIVNHWVTWFARWSQRIVSNRKAIGDAVDLAKRSLLSRNPMVKRRVHAGQTASLLTSSTW